MNIKLDATFDLVVEGRYNSFEDANPNLDGWGVALGLKVKLEPESATQYISSGSHHDDPGR